MKIKRASVAGIATLIAVLVPAGAAQAHVRVSPDTAAPGSYATLTFKVPTETAKASTQKVVVDLPADHPFGSVSYQQIPGWSVQVTESKLPKPITTGDATITTAPTRVTWTATGAATQIKPGQFQTFAISAGPVPDVGSLMLPATQYYTDGSVVDWNQTTPASGDEPEHPAPVLYVNSAPPAPAAASSKAPAASVAAAPAKTESTVSSAGVWFGVGGIGLAALALVVATYALTRPRRSE